jgi:O-antigen/teichoic acid export membrane protein
LNSPTLGDVPTTEPIHSESEPPARVIANSAWMVLAQGVVTVVGGAVSIYAIRSLSTSSWGYFSTAFALIAVFMIFAGPGLAPLALREMTAAPRRQAEILGMSLQALWWTFCLAVIALFATTALLGYPHRVFVLVLVMAPLLALEPALAIIAAAFNARSQLVYVALLQVVRALVYGALVVVVIATSRGVTGLAVATLVAAFCASLLAVVLLRARLTIRPRLNQPSRLAWSFLRTAFPIAGIGLVGVVYDRVDILLLSVLATSSKVAFYTVPYGFVRLSWVLPSIVSAAFFPLLSRRLKSDPAQAEYLFFLVVRVFLFLSLPIALVLAVSSSTLVPFVYGDPYTHSVAVLQIMAWTSVFGFQNYILWYGVLASHQERPAFAVQAAGLFVNVGINALAIPLYGANGAAAALVVSDLVVVVGQAFLIHRNLFRVPFRDLLTKPLGASIIAVPIALVVAMWTAVGGALIGGAAYIGVLLILRYVTFEEWKPLLSFVEAPFAALRRGRPRPS